MTSISYKDIVDGIIEAGGKGEENACTKTNHLQQLFVSYRVHTMSQPYIPPCEGPQDRRRKRQSYRWFLGIQLSFTFISVYLSVLQGVLRLEPTFQYTVTVLSIIVYHLNIVKTAIYHYMGCNQGQLRQYVRCSMLCLRTSTYRKASHIRSIDRYVLLLWRV